MTSVTYVTTTPRTPTVSRGDKLVAVKTCTGGECGGDIVVVTVFLIQFNAKIHPLSERRTRSTKSRPTAALS